MAFLVLLGVLRGVTAAVYRPTPSCPASLGPQTLEWPWSEQKLLIYEMDNQYVHFEFRDVL
jgi:hypothetical protein